MIRLSFTGDLLAYHSFIKRSKKKDGYSFSRLFEYTKRLFKESDYVVGNLETPLAGKKAGYTITDMLFNTPDEFAVDANEAGFDMFTTANNHCLDKGVEGLIRTLSVLDFNHIEHTGTFRDKNERRYLLKEIKGVKFAFISFTYGTNPNVNGVELSEEDEFIVNLTKKPEKAYQRPIAKQLLLNILYRLPLKLQNKIHPVYPQHLYIDCVAPKEVENIENVAYLEKMKHVITSAKENADIVVFCLHSGGQFNNEVGDYTNFLIEKIKNLAVDVLIVNHPHCVLGSKWNNDNSFVAYSLGNFCFTPGEGYFIEGAYGEYGVVLHLDFDEKKKKLNNVSYNIVKNVLLSKHQVQVIPVDILSNKCDENMRKILERDVSAVVNRFSGTTGDTYVIKDSFYIQKQ